MSGRRIAGVVAVVAVALAGLGGTARAQERGALAGGGNLNQVAIELPQGATLGPLYSVYAANNTGAPVRMDFAAQAPTGITVTPTRPQIDIRDGQLERVNFSVAVDNTTAPGDYPVSVGLARTDVNIAPGKLAFAPAFATSFTVRVTGASGTVLVRATDLATGGPAKGVITLARTDGGKRLDMARAEGSDLRAVVAPGQYEARFEIGGRELASKPVTVGDGQIATVDFEVKTIDFQAVGLRQNLRGGKLQTVQIDALLSNGLDRIKQAQTRLIVERNGRPLETVDLKSYDPLPLGSEPISARYVPADGWEAGEYRFTLALEGSGIAVRATTQPTMRVDAAAASPRARAASWMAAAGAGAAVLVLVGIVVAWALARRRRRRSARTAGTDRAPTRLAGHDVLPPTPAAPSTPEAPSTPAMSSPPAATGRRAAPSRLTRVPVPAPRARRRRRSVDREAREEVTSGTLGEKGPTAGDSSEQRK